MSEDCTPMVRRFLALWFLIAALVSAPLRARADDDAVQFFHNIEVTPDMPVGDAVCFFCNVHLEGKASGDVVVLFGNVWLSGQTSGDVVDLFGHISAASDSSVGGDLVSVFGAIRLGENVRIGGDMVSVFGVSHAPHSVSVKGDRVGLSPWIIFAPFLVVFLVVYLVVHELRTRRMRIAAAGYPGPPMPPIPPQAPPQR
jgi:hypothetical protein